MSPQIKACVAYLLLGCSDPQPPAHEINDLGVGDASGVDAFDPARMDEGLSVECSAEGWRCDRIDNDCDGHIDEDPPCNGVEGHQDFLEPQIGFEAQTYPWVVVPSGVYTRGNDGDVYQHEGPAHLISLSRDILVSSVEVTNSQWHAVAVNLSGKSSPALHECPECPVERVSWYEAVWFANKVTELHNTNAEHPLTLCYTLAGCQDFLEIGIGCPAGSQFECDGLYNCTVVTYDHTCTGYRLLTSTEWEIAARARQESPYWFGDPEDIQRHEHCEAYGEKTLVANAKPPNPFGLRHMLGNVGEWVFDADLDPPDWTCDYSLAAREAGPLIDPIAEPPVGADLHRYYRGAFCQCGSCVLSRDE